MLRAQLAPMLANLPRRRPRQQVPPVIQVQTVELMSPRNRAIHVQQMDLVPSEARGMLRLRVELQVNVHLIRPQPRLSSSAGEAQGKSCLSDATALYVPQCTAAIEQQKASGEASRSGKE